MREIMFRGKAEYNGEWVEGGFYKYKDTAWIIVPGDSYIGLKHYQVDPSTVCQYTGLKDKNGRKIWENDIVKITIFDYATGKILACGNSKVEFKKGCFGVKWGFSKGFCMFDDFAEKYTEFEVIGNIFDNPELLEV